MVTLSDSPFPRRGAVVAAVAVAVTGLSGVVPVTGGVARAGSAALPLGDADLTETRTVQTLAPGVTLTRIERGTEPAEPDQIPRPGAARGG